MPRNRVQHQKGLSDDAFEQRYPDEEACRKAWFAWRWPEGFKCPRCAWTKYSEIQGRQSLKRQDRRKLGSHVTLRWRKADSNPRSRDDSDDGFRLNSGLARFGETHRPSPSRSAAECGLPLRRRGFIEMRRNQRSHGKTRPPRRLAVSALRSALTGSRRAG